MQNKKWNLYTRNKALKPLNEAQNRFKQPKTGSLSVKKMVKLVVLLLDASIWSMKGETFSNANI